MGTGFCALIGAAALTIMLGGNADAACGADAIGVSRVLKVDTSQGLEVGAWQYHHTLPLAPREVVLTFDDGPLPGTTTAVLPALREACAKATFFVVGTMAAAHPELVRALRADGNTVGTHSYSHPETLSALTYEEGVLQIDRGIAAVGRALGEPPAPFFRFPGLGHTQALRAKLAKQGIGVFSVDAMASDWALFTGDAVRQKALQELERHNGGILLLHDTKHATAKMLPQLLRDLKQHGFRLVHIVPAAPPVAMSQGRTTPTIAP